jgi:hypothetical protein
MLLHFDYMNLLITSYPEDVILWGQLRGRAADLHHYNADFGFFLSLKCGFGSDFSH